MSKFGFPKYTSPLGIIDLNKVNHTLVIFLPIFFLAIMLAIKVLDNHLFWTLLNEDGLLETFQAISYLCGGIIAVSVSKRFKRLGYRALHVIYLILALALVFVAFEEVSWGQRIFNLDTPRVLIERNTQEELNIHNIDTMQNYLHVWYIAVALGGGLVWLITPSYLLKKWNCFLAYVIPSPLTFLYFLPAGLFYIYLEGITRGFWPNLGGSKPQEMFETPFALGFVVFVLYNKIRSNKLPELKLQRETR